MDFGWKDLGGKERLRFNPWVELHVVSVLAHQEVQTASNYYYTLIHIIKIIWLNIV